MMHNGKFFRNEFSWMRWLFLVLVIGLNLTCELLKNPAKPGEDNPFDPDNPDYVPPTTEIYTGPHDSETIGVDSVIFKWRGSHPECYFSYSLDDETWSEWSRDTVLIRTYLDEGDHAFSVKCRYPSGEVEKEPLVIRFTVDAIAGPALWICHKKTSTLINSDFSIDVILEEVSNLSMASIVVNFDPTYLQIQSYAVLEDESILSGKQLIKVNNYDNNGKLTVYLALVGESNPVLSGTGSIIRVHFLSLKRGTTEIEFGDECYFRKADNTEIPIVNKVKSLVEIE